MDNEERRTHYIPINYKTYSSFHRWSFKKSTTIQAVFLTGIACFVMFYVLGYNFENSDVTPTLLVGIFVFSLSAMGIKGYSLLGYLGIIIRYFKNKRSLYYNPRVKTESISILTEEIKKQDKPLRKAMNLFSQRYKEIQSRMRKEEDEDLMFVFEDDKKGKGKK